MRITGSLIAAVVSICLPTAALAQAADAVLPRAAIEDGFKKAECSVPIEDAAKEPDSYDLGGGQKLFVVSCWRAAYQSGSLVFVMDGSGQARLLTFQHWNGKKFTPDFSLSEADFDPNGKAISMFYKGRGIGDCGAMATWNWTGSEFKLKDYYFKEKCDGRSFAGERRWRIFPRR
jgi:hypothetical protein